MPTATVTPAPAAPERNPAALPLQFHRQLLSITRHAATTEGEETWYDIIISTETPLRKPYGIIDILSHSRNAVDLSHAKNGLTLYLEHGNPMLDYPDPDYIIGVVKDVKLVDRELHGRMKFSRASERGVRAEAMVNEGTLQFISQGWEPRLYKSREVVIDDQAYLERTWTRWAPREVSLVGVPADSNAGVERNSAAQMFAVEREGEEPVKEEGAMPETQTTTQPPAAAPAATAAPAPAAPAPVQQHSAGVVTAEARNEIVAIIDLCRHNKMPEKADEFIKGGYTMQQAKAAMYELRTAQPERVPSSEQLPRLDPKEAKNYRLIDALEGSLAMRHGRAVPKSFALDVHQQIVGKLPVKIENHGGFFVPLLASEHGATPPPKREVHAMGSNVATGGAELVFTSPGDLIEKFNNRTVVFRRGGRLVVGLTGPVQYPKVSQEVSVSWMGENPAAEAAQSEMKFGTVLMSPKTLIGWAAIPRQWLNMSAFAIEARLQNSFAGAHGRAIDFGVLHGSGSQFQPQGIYNITNVLSQAWNASAIFDALIDAETKVADQNADEGTLGWVMTVSMGGKLKKTLVASAAGSEHIWRGNYREGELATGFPASASNQLSKTLGSGGDEHGMIFGNWADSETGLWGAFEVIADEVTLAGKGQIRINTFQMADSIIRHEESFCVITGAKPA